MSVSRLFKAAAVAVATLGLSSAAYAGCNSGSFCSASTSNYSSYSAASQQVVPFSTSVSNVSNVRLAGLGSNERLCPTKCPVNVYNPNGGKVLGCYNVCKTAPVVQTNYVQTYVRVVRPIIYVRYPVPTPVEVPVYLPRPAPVCAPVMPVCGPMACAPMPPRCGY